MQGHLGLAELLVLFLYLLQVPGCHRLEQVALQLGHLEELVIVERLLQVGEDDHAGEDGMVVGHVGIAELRAVLQLHLKAAAEFLGIDLHLLDIDLGQDRFSFLSRHLGAFYPGPRMIEKSFSKNKPAALYLIEIADDPYQGKS